MNLRSKYLKPLVLSVLFLAIGNAFADHLPDKLLANGEPETQLGKISLVTSKIEDVIKIFGQPTHILNVPNNPNWTGYSWDIKGTRLEVGVAHDSSSAQIEDVYIEGLVPGLIDGTGRGLRLGDTLANLKNIYGNHFELSSNNNGPSHKREAFTGVQVSSEYKVATIQWQSEEFTLRVGFDPNGKIDAMWLQLPECYPDGCE